MNGHLCPSSVIALAVEPLSDKAARELIVESAGEEIAAGPAGARLIARAGGLPVQLLPVSEALAYEAGRGRPAVQLDVSPLTENAAVSFSIAYRAVERPERLVLHAMAGLAPDRVERVELDAVLAAADGWSQTEVTRALDVCVNRHLVEGIDQLRMHQLLAAYVASLEPDGVIIAYHAALVNACQERLIACAEAVGTTPGDRDVRARFLSHLIEFRHWESHHGFSSEDRGAVGRALLELGKFNEARPWFERAVTEAEQGDVHGRVDHESLDVSVHHVGFCWSSVGKFDEARPWIERAVTEKQQGGVHGRVDHDSLEGSRQMLASLQDRAAEP